MCSTEPGYCPQGAGLLMVCVLCVCVCVWYVWCVRPASQFLIKPALTAGKQQKDGSCYPILLLMAVPRSAQAEGSSVPHCLAKLLTGLGIALPRLPVYHWVCLLTRRPESELKVL